MKPWRDVSQMRRIFYSYSEVTTFFNVKKRNTRIEYKSIEQMEGTTMGKGNFWLSEDMRYLELGVFID